MLEYKLCLSDWFMIGVSAMQCINKKNNRNKNPLKSFLKNILKVNNLPF